MNEIVMIPIERLIHHPENPRLDLGDLTELADSIRQNGVMQNLTVVPKYRSMTDLEYKDYCKLYQEHPTEKLRTMLNSVAGGTTTQGVIESGDFYVVIGNRRMEASKMAGVDSLPCVISDMSHEEQISTMIQENMQRQDLTVYEQAMGFQTMMNLGYSQEQISEKTGISKTTVRRRLKMAELTPSLLKEKCAEQIGMGVFEKIAQIDDLNERNHLLAEAGKDNFNWAFTQAMRKQKTAEVLPAAKQQIRAAKAKKIERSQSWSNDYDHCGRTIYLYEWDVEKPLLPKEAAGAKELFYYLDGNELAFFTKHKRAEPVRKTEEEKAEERRIAESWEQAREDTKTARQLRRQFADSLTVTSKNIGKMMCHALLAATLTEISYGSPSMQLRELLDTKDVYGPDGQTQISKNFWAMEMKDWPKIIRCFFDTDNNDGYVGGYQRDMPQFKPNQLLDEYYKWLCEFGYEMSDVELKLMNGTHPCFGRKKE